MRAPLPVGVTSGSLAPALRMRSLLLSWLLLATLGVLGQLLFGLLVLRQVELTAAALWTAALVTACQALALESLAAPLGLGAFGVRAGASLRRPGVAALWLSTAAAVAAARLVAGAGLPILNAAAALSALLAASLFGLAAWRPGEREPARPALTALAALLLLSASNRVFPWLTLLATGLPRLTRTLLVGLLMVALYRALFRAQRRLAGRRDTAAGWLGAAAGLAALGLAANLLPLSLMTSVGDTPLAGPSLLVLATSCLATAGICLAAPPEER